MTDVVTVVEKAGRGVVIDPPSFHSNIKELTDYLNSQNIKIDGVVFSYHMAGASFLPDVKKYSTKKADDFARNGHGKVMVADFAKDFGVAFDPNLPVINDFIKDSQITIGGIDLNIVNTSDAFDIEIPTINSFYTHMLGHDTHSIIASTALAQEMIEQLDGFLDKGYRLVLSGHHIPEDSHDVESKIHYLDKLIAVAGSSESAGEFKNSMKKLYPDFKGENYLDMTASFLFP
jgi:hypothetical protein